MPAQQHPVEADDDHDRRTTPTYASRRTLLRRTSIETSTMTMPPRAVIAEACPDGKAPLCSSASGCCHDGRSRPTTALMTVVDSDVTIITPAVKNAARG